MATSLIVQVVTKEISFNFMDIKYNKIKMIGWVGTVLLMATYMLNILGVMSAQSLLYLFLNLLAAFCLGVRVLHDKNYSNVFLEIFWAGVAIVGIIRYFY